MAAETVRRLACDASVVSIIWPEASSQQPGEPVEPLNVCRKTRTISAPLRRFLNARDRGCRFPGSTMPVAYTDVDHLDGRADGHHIDRMISLARRYHRIRHHHGWQLDLDPNTGIVTAQRGKRRYRSLPRGTPLQQRE